MKTMKTTLALLLALGALTQALAGEFVYRGKIQGMACAFCVYKVTTSLGKLPGVDADAVNIDLKSGTLQLRATQALDKRTVAKTLTDAGFTLTAFGPASKFEQARYGKTPALTLTLDGKALAHYLPVLDKLGEAAASKPSKLVIRAPKSLHAALLKALIAGRQRAIRVQLDEDSKPTVAVSLYRQTH